MQIYGIGFLLYLENLTSLFYQKKQGSSDDEAGASKGAGGSDSGSDSDSESSSDEDVGCDQMPFWSFPKMLTHTHLL